MNVNKNALRGENWDKIGKKSSDFDHCRKHFYFLGPSCLYKISSKTNKNAPVGVTTDREKDLKDAIVEFPRMQI